MIFKLRACFRTSLSKTCQIFSRIALACQIKARLVQVFHIFCQIKPIKDKYLAKFRKFELFFYCMLTLWCQMSPSIGQTRILNQIFLHLKIKIALKKVLIQLTSICEYQMVVADMLSQLLDRTPHLHRCMFDQLARPEQSQFPFCYTMQ